MGHGSGLGFRMAKRALSSQPRRSIEGGSLGKAPEAIPSPVPPLLGLGHRRRHVRYGLRAGAGTRWHRFGWRGGWHHDLKRRRRLEPRQQLPAKAGSFAGQWPPRSAHLYDVGTSALVATQGEEGEEPAAIDHRPITVLATP